jgi:hypothetical protein
MIVFTDIYVLPRALKLPIYEVFIILKDLTMTWQKWGSKQALEKRKTSLSLMKVFNIALKCSLQFEELLNASIVRICKAYKSISVVF